MKKAFVLAVAAFVSLSSAAAQSDTNFMLPSECGGRATGAASSLLATESDPPVVLVYRLAARKRENKTKFIKEYLQNVYVRPGEGKSWIAEFTLPTMFNYSVATIYTPFLVSYQSVAGVPGVRLNPPTVRPPSRLFPQFTVKLPTGYGGAFVEFLPDYPGADPFTMQADSYGRIELYCYVYRETSRTQVTVYSQSHELVGTGRIDIDSGGQPSGQVIFDRDENDPMDVDEQ